MRQSAPFNTSRKSFRAGLIVGKLIYEEEPQDSSPEPIGDSGLATESFRLREPHLPRRIHACDNVTAMESCTAAPMSSATWKRS